MCVAIQNTLAGKLVRQQDLLRSKFADAVGLEPPRDFLAEWVHGKAASNNNYAIRKKPRSQESGLAIQTDTPRG